MKRFFSNTLPLLLDVDSRHAIKVLRCRENETIEIIDGNGKLYQAQIFVIQKNEIQLYNIQLIEEEKNNQQQLSIAIAPTKNPARLEWFIEKATEIGIRKIYPIITERTEKNSIKFERLQQIALAATKQSKQLFIPELFPIQSFKDFLQMEHTETQKCIAHCTAESSQTIQKVYTKNKPIVVCIGPEGDFTENEISLAFQHHFTPITLGKSTLRTETAGVYVSSIISMLNQL